MNLRFFSFPSLLRVMAFLALLAGCVDKPQDKPQKPAAGKPVALTIAGYNYTGRYIHTFSVNGQWGGNLYETSAGSRLVCCLSFNPATRLPFEVKVEWTLNDRKDFKNDQWLSAPEEHHSATVQVTGPLPKNDPHSFEVHFMPDGSVQAYVTHLLSTPFYFDGGQKDAKPQVSPPGDGPNFKN